MEKDYLEQMYNAYGLMMDIQRCRKLLDCNEYTVKYGLELTEEDVKLLVNERKEELAEQQRVEFGDGIMQKLIHAFCDSPYIMQDNYVDSLVKLQEIFYLYKNESLDEVSDDELIDYMHEKYEWECHGSLEILEETYLEEFARDVREGTIQFMGKPTKERYY